MHMNGTNGHFCGPYFPIGPRKRLAPRERRAHGCGVSKAGPCDQRGWCRAARIGIQVSSGLVQDQQSGLHEQRFH